MLIGFMLFALFVTAQFSLVQDKAVDLVGSYYFSLSRASEQLLTSYFMILVESEIHDSSCAQVSTLILGAQSLQLWSLVDSVALVEDTFELDVPALEDCNFLKLDLGTHSPVIGSCWIPFAVANALINF